MLILVKHTPISSQTQESDNFPNVFPELSDCAACQQGAITRSVSFMQPQRRSSSQRPLVHAAAVRLMDAALLLDGWMDGWRMKMEDDDGGR